MWNNWKSRFKLRLRFSIKLRLCFRCNGRTTRYSTHAQIGRTKNGKLEGIKRFYGTTYHVQQHYHVTSSNNQALYSLFEGCHSSELCLPHATIQASSIVASETPLLHMFANARMCFMPYWVNDPQWVSKTRTCNPVRSDGSLLAVVIWLFTALYQKRENIKKIYHRFETRPIVDNSRTRFSQGTEDIRTLFWSK